MGLQSDSAAGKIQRKKLPSGESTKIEMQEEKLQWTLYFIYIIIESQSENYSIKRR